MGHKFIKAKHRKKKPLNIQRAGRIIMILSQGIFQGQHKDSRVKINCQIKYNDFSACFYKSRVTGTMNQMTFKFLKKS